VGGCCLSCNDFLLAHVKRHEKTQHTRVQEELTRTLRESTFLTRTLIWSSSWSNEEHQSTLQVSQSVSQSVSHSVSHSLTHSVTHSLTHSDPSRTLVCCVVLCAHSVAPPVQIFTYICKAITDVSTRETACISAYEITAYISCA
jgi:hypothetical protein